MKTTGVNLIVSLPPIKLDSEGKPQPDPDGKPKAVSVGPGFVFYENKKELPRPYKIDYPDGRVFQLDSRFMDVFKIKRESDLMRVIRNCSIILTNFTGPLEQDKFGVHLERLKRWIGKGDWQRGIDGLVTAFPIIEILIGYDKPQFDIKEYGNAAIVFALHFGLW